MPINYIQRPQNLSPIYNENYLKIIDSDAVLAGYKYIIKVYQKQATADAYELIGTYSQFPLKDGTLEFDANSVLVNYMLNNNFDYKLLGGIYRNSLFQGKISIYRTTTANTAEVLVCNFDPLYIFDASLAQSEMDNITAILAKKNPQVVTATYTVTWYTTDTLTNKVGFFEGLLTGGGEAPSSIIFTAGMTELGNNGYHKITSREEIVPGIIILWTDLDSVGAISDGTVKFFGLSTTDNRSISNCPMTLELSQYDYYTADFFNWMPSVSTGSSWRNIGLEISTPSGLRWYNLVPNPNNDKNIQEDIVTLPIGGMNIKLLNWQGFEGTVTGQDIFNNYVFSSYKIYLNGVLSEAGNTDWPFLMNPIKVNVCSQKKDVKRFDRTWLIYKSKLGGWSWLSFNMKASKSIEIVPVTYNRRLKYNEKYTSRGATTISSEITTKYVLNTDWVDVSEWEYFEDLFTSGQIYMFRQYVNGVLNTNDPFCPVICRTAKTPIFSPNNDKLFQYTIEVETANKNIRQR